MSAFLRSDSRCRRYVSDLSDVTPRYLGSEQKGRVLLLCLTLSSRLVSLLLRWKAADTVFVVLSFSFQVWRYSLIVAMSLVSTPSTACQSPSEAAIANHLHDHDHVNHVSIRQQLQQLAGEAAVPCSVLGCCEVDKHSSGLLFSRKAILDVLCQQGDLVYGRPPVSKVCLLVREQWVDDCVDMSLDGSLEDFKGVTQQGYGMITLWVPQWLFWLRHRNY